MRLGVTTRDLSVAFVEGERSEPPAAGGHAVAPQVKAPRSGKKSGYRGAAPGES
jgi:hypothetical protein